MAVKPSWLLASLSSAFFLQPLPQINVLQGAEHLMLMTTLSGKPICFHNLTFNCWELPVHSLDLWFSKSGLQTSSLSITWELIRNASFGVPFQTCGIRHFGVQPLNVCLKGPSKGL